MTFEEDFLGLKGKAHFITEFKLGETPEETIIAHDGKHKINLLQEPHSFEGKTVNLMGDSCRIYNEKDIKKHCLDKKKVQDLIDWINENMILSEYEYGGYLEAQHQEKEYKLKKQELGLK